MGIEGNKRTVQAFIDRLCAGGGLELLADDFEWWLPDVGRIDKAGFQPFVDLSHGMFARPMTLTVRHMTAEDDRVAVEMRGHAELRDGRTYANLYHYLFFLRDGLIHRIHEHADTGYAARVFGTSLDGMQGNRDDARGGGGAP